MRFELGQPFAAPEYPMQHRKVLLVVIDGASSRVFCPAVQTGRLAALQQLAAAGTMHESSVSIFPSITPAATSSIITGSYPAEHGIEGAAWLQDRDGSIAYYGDDVWVIARKGAGTFLRDFLGRLNGDLLHAPTIFELVERSGRKAASLNYLVHRGLHEHRVRLPGVVRLLGGAPPGETVRGPSILHLGTIVETPGAGAGRRHVKGGPLHRFGMDDESTGALLCSIIESGSLPDFTVAYFADNDFRSHDVGPCAALPVLDRVDAMLAAAFDRAGGLERFLRHTAVIVTSDHGHCELLADGERAVVRLDAVLEDVARLGRLGAPWDGHDEAMVCPNMRAAQIYLRADSPALRQRIVNRLLAADGVDQVLWLAPQAAEDATYVVASARGRLQFGRARRDGEGAEDAFGTRWRWSGDPEVLDVRTDGGRLRYGAYPNAFERIEGSLSSDQSGDIWATARPGREFEAPGNKAHVGGASHGALHALDSLSPVIVSGAPAGFALPEAFRSVDLAPLCMELLGLRMRYAVGDPRVPASSGQSHL
jgi:hypothetical protein